MAKLVSRADLARLGGVTKVAISKAAKARLAPACVGDRMDLEHPEVVAWLDKKRKQREATGTPHPAEDLELEHGIEPADVPEMDDPFPELASLSHMTVRQVAERYGTKRAYRDWLDALKRIEDVHRAGLDNAKLEGRLIERDLVDMFVFGPYEAQCLRLLSDIPKTGVRRVYAMALAGEPIEVAERVLREMIEAQLKVAKNAASRALKSA